MKKLSLGSFPLTEIRSSDRKCLDRYMIKTFSDNISISDAVRNLSATKNMMYITPDSLMSNWLQGESKDKDRNHRNDRTGNSEYQDILKRAFYIIKEFYKRIKGAPFYKNYIFYPIYIENVEKITTTIDQKSVHLDYSFLIISNDLTKGLKVDEIKYDENASLNFLFLFVEFFSSDSFGGSIHDFNQEKYEYLVKMYQFIENSGKEPISMVLDLYKLFGMIKKSMDIGTRRIDIASTLDSFDDSILKKYKGMLNNKLFSLSRTLSRSTTPATKMQYADAFIELMNAIFKSEGLSGLYNGVDSSAERNERLQYVYRSNKYHEILNLAKELVQYNKLDCKDVLNDDSMQFDFKIERGEYTVETQRHVLAQQYQMFFKSYVESIKKYIESIVGTIIEELNITSKLKSATKRKMNKTIKEVKAYEDKIDTQRVNISRLNDHIKINTDHLALATNPADKTIYQNAINSITIQIKQHQALIDGYNNEIKTLEILNNQFKDYNQSIDSDALTVAKDVQKDITASIISSLANDLTFVYDDGKSFFGDDLIATGFVEFVEDPATDITELNNFKKIVSTAGSIPQTRTINNNKVDNPKFHTAQLLSGLMDTFGIMADDTITAIEDNFRISVQRVLNEKIPNGRSSGNAGNEYISDILNSLFVTSSSSGGLFASVNKPGFRDKLMYDVYADRFISGILLKFKNYLRLHKTTKKIEHNADVSRLHPLLAKLIKNGNKCQYFKSFVINYETCDMLYNTKFILDTQKFLTGVTNTPPTRVNNPMNKLQTVLHDYLGLKNNPVWVISKQNVYLSMPDDLSLTNSSILSTIPKTELMDVCKIKASDYWNENMMGKVTEIGNKKLSEARKKVEAKNKEISDLKKEINNLSSKDKDRQINLNKKMDKYQKQKDDLEEKVNKVKIESKDIKPNAFLFADDDVDPENTELFTQGEKADLARAREKTKEDLLRLKPSEDDLIDLQKQQDYLDKKTFADDLEDTSEPEPEPETEIEKLIRERDEAIARAR